MDNQSLGTLKVWQRYAFFAVCFLLPFERIPSFDAAGFTVKLSYLAALLLLAISVPLAFGKKKADLLAVTPSDKLLFLFWVFGMVSVIQSPERGRSLIIVALWAFMFLIYFVSTRLFSQEHVRRMAEDVILIVSALVCLFGIYQFVGDAVGLSTRLTGLRDMYTKAVLGFPRIQSVGLEPLYFSNFLLMPLMIALRRFLVERKASTAYGGLIILMLCNIILGISRGAYLALGIAFVILAVYVLLTRRERTVIPQRVLSALILVLVSGFISWGLISQFSGSEATDSFVNHASVSDTNTGTSVPGRIEGYRIAFNLFKENPIIGIGVGAFGPRTVQSEEELKTYGYGIVNNEYLEILTETGVVGAVVFLSFIFSLLWKGIVAYRTSNPKQRTEQIFATAGVVAIAVQYNFFSTLYIISIWVFLAYAVAHFNSATYK